MPSFLYKARIEGEVQQNEIEAESQNKAIVKLQQKSIKPLSIKKIKNNQQVNSKGSLFSKRKQEITEKNMVVFTRTFSTLIDAGLPLVQCLDILGKQNENPSFGEIIIAIKKNIESGDTLSESLKDYPEVFNSLYCNLVEAGEAAGILDTILRRLAIHIEKAASLKKKVKSAMVYPACIVTVAVGVIAFLMIFVIPAFATMFSSGGAQLPVPTAIVMSTSDLFRDHWYYMISLSYFTYFLIKKLYVTENGRFFIDKYSLTLPVVGDLIRKVSIAKFSRTLGTLLASGVALLQGLEICARTSGNKVIELSVMKTIDAVTGGETIAKPLARGGVFPPMVIQMIDVGESSGSLDTMLAKIADFYDEEVDTAVVGLTALLEPALMVFLGLLVGFIVVAMYLPIFEMGSAI
jgi:type IV pilus assembly protein PilC